MRKVRNDNIKVSLTAEIAATVVQLVSKHALSSSVLLRFGADEITMARKKKGKAFGLTKQKRDKKTTRIVIRVTAKELATYSSTAEALEIALSELFRRGIERIDGMDDRNFDRAFQAYEFRAFKGE